MNTRQHSTEQVISIFSCGYAIFLDDSLSPVGTVDLHWHRPESITHDAHVSHCGTVGQLLKFHALYKIFRQLHQCLDDDWCSMREYRRSSDDEHRSISYPRFFMSFGVCPGHNRRLHQSDWPFFSRNRFCISSSILTSGLSGSITADG